MKMEIAYCAKCDRIYYERGASVWIKFHKCPKPDAARLVAGR